MRIAAIGLVLAILLTWPSLASPPPVRAPELAPHAAPGISGIQIPSGSGAPWTLAEGPTSTFSRGTPQIRASTSPANALVDAPCNVTSNAEVQQAYDPATGYLYETWIGCSGIGFSRSVDGGLSFQPAKTVLGSGGVSSWDPSIALAPNGTVYVAFMRNIGNGDAPEVAWSWDHGQSFAGNATAFLPKSSVFGDREFIAVAPNGTIFLSWDYSPPGSNDTIGCAVGGSCYFISGAYDILVVRSSNGGANWSNPVAINPEYPWGAAPAGPLLVTPNGTVEMLFEDYATNSSHFLLNGSNYFTRSTNDGRSWSTPVRIPAGPLSPKAWWIDGALARSSTGVLYAGYDTQDRAGDTAWVSVSRDGGVSWNSPIRVNPDQNSAVHIMVTPATGESGTAYVAWMTNNSTGGGWTTWAAYLSGNGSMVGSPVQVSSNVGLPGYWPGDTIGVTAIGVGRTAVSWSFGVTLGNFTASQVYAAVISDPLPSPPLLLNAVPGIGSVALNWTEAAQAAPVSGFLVQWNSTAQPAVNRSVPFGVNATTVAGLSAFVRYSFRVFALNPSGRGAASNLLFRTLTAWSSFSANVVPPNAVVTLDNRSPSTSIMGNFSWNSTPGPHSLNASSPGYDAVSEQVFLAWNSSLSVFVNLSASPGEVRGVVQPSSASVTWDGVPLAVSAKGNYDVVTPGFTTHSLRFDAPLRVSQQKTVFVPGGTVEWLNTTLVWVNGTLALAITPYGARATLNGSSVALGTDGRANLTLRPGVYSLTVSALGYVTKNRTVTVPAGALVPLLIDLTPGASSGAGTGSFLGGALLWVGLGIGALVIVVVAIAAARREGLRPPPVDVLPLEPEYASEVVPVDDVVP